MFYGFYNNTLVEDQNFSYNLPLAYLFTAVFYFAFCFICIIARSVPALLLSSLLLLLLLIDILQMCGCVQLNEMSRMPFKSLSGEFSHPDPRLFLDRLLTHRMGSAARVAVATGGSAVGNYSMIVFASWDYGCLGDKATKLKQKNIRYQLQVRGDLSYLAGWRAGLWWQFLLGHLM